MIDMAQLVEKRAKKMYDNLDKQKATSKQRTQQNVTHPESVQESRLPERENVNRSGSDPLTSDRLNDFIREMRGSIKELRDEVRQLRTELERMKNDDR